MRLPIAIAALVAIRLLQRPPDAFWAGCAGLWLKVSGKFARCFATLVSVIKNSIPPADQLNEYGGEDTTKDGDVSGYETFRMLQVVLHIAAGFFNNFNRNSLSGRWHKSFRLEPQDTPILLAIPLQRESVGFPKYGRSRGAASVIQVSPTAQRAFAVDKRYAGLLVPDLYLPF